MANESKQEEVQSAEVTVNYEKATNHQVVRADGFWMAITPQLEIEMAAYNDLHPMPRKVTQQITENGLGKEVSQEVDSGILRLVGVTIVLNPVIAKQVVELLERMLKQIDTAQESRSAATEVEPAEATEVH